MNVLDGPNQYGNIRLVVGDYDENRGPHDVINKDVPEHLSNRTSWEGVQSWVCKTIKQWVWENVDFHEHEYAPEEIFENDIEFVWGSTSDTNFNNRNAKVTIRMNDEDRDIIVTFRTLSVKLMVECDKSTYLPEDGTIT